VWESSFGRVLGGEFQQGRERQRREAKPAAGEPAIEAAPA
jgi:hypothetical protein